MKDPTLTLGALAAVLALGLQGVTLALREPTWTLVATYAGAPLVLVTLVAVLRARRLLQRAALSTNAANGQSELDRQRLHDGLTGLPRRELLLDHMRLALPQAKRLGTKVAVLFIDLDRFETVNGSLGRRAGDVLLRAVAQRLRGVTRQGDTVARLGGDEFTILAQGVRKPDDCAKIARNIQEAVSAPFSIEGRELFLTASIGISLYPDDGAETEDLIDAADTAMHRAKKLGGGSYELYTTAMNADALERLELENDLRQALERQQLVLHYQPIVDASTGRLLACEALLRWQHPDKGLLSPAVFLGIAELTGLIVAIGPWILHTACEQVKRWQEQGGPRLSVAVNLSPRQLTEADLVERVREALEVSGLDPTHLELEITESLAMQNPETTIETLRELKALGVSLSIDDFGTGYSSLSYLKRFPIDTLKIDRSFVRDIHTSHEDATITATMVAMAQALGLGVIAEGVETEEQLRVVRAQGCNRWQGYLFSRPVPPEQFGSLLEKSYDSNGQAV